MVALQGANGVVQERTDADEQIYSKNHNGAKLRKEDANNGEIDSDDGLTTVGSSSSLDVDQLLQPAPKEDWDLEILRASPFYWEGDEQDEFLTGPYRILDEEHRRKSAAVAGYLQPFFDHVRIEPVETFYKMHRNKDVHLSQEYPFQFDDALPQPKS